MLSSRSYTRDTREGIEITSAKKKDSRESPRKEFFFFHDAIFFAVSEKKSTRIHLLKKKCFLPIFFSVTVDAKMFFTQPKKWE